MRKNEMINRPAVGGALRAALTVGLVLSLGTSAFAQWAVEGPITAIDPVAHTITANGMTFEVPADFQILGPSITVTGATMHLLLDENAPSRHRSIFPGPGHSGATTISTGTGTTGNFVAGFCFIEMAENVLNGVLDSANPDGSLTVNGARVAASLDERFEAGIGDIGGEPISAEVIATLVGTQVVAEGYVAGDTLHGGVVTNFLPDPPPGSDIVRITFGRALVSKMQIRSTGVVAPFDPLAPQTISLFDGDTGVLFGTGVAIPDAVPGRGFWSIRVDGVSLNLQQSIRAVSENGGEHTIDPQVRP